MRLYEGMFLLDSGRAGKDWDGASSEVEALLERHGAGIRVAGRWDERKLAYEIKGQRRATYMLAYFVAPSEAIAGIRRDCELSDLVLRNMILARPEGHEIPEELGKNPVPVAATASEPAAKPTEKSATKKEA